MVVFGVDEQWAADLIEVINKAKYNQGYCYLLMVVDALSKHAWVQAVTDAFQKLLKGRRKPINLQTDDVKEFYNKIRHVPPIMTGLWSSGRQRKVQRKGWLYLHAQNDLTTVG